MLTCAVVLGVATGGLMPGWTAMLAPLYGPLHYGGVMGRMLPVIGVMGALIVPLVGHLFDRNGDYVIAFVFLAALVLVAAVFLAPMRHDARRAGPIAPPGGMST